MKQKFPRTNFYKPRKRSRYHGDLPYKEIPEPLQLFCLCLEVNTMCFLLGATQADTNSLRTWAKDVPGYYRD